MERYELKGFLDGLDQAHAELIHAHLCYGLVNAPLSEMIGQEMVEQYRRLCDRLIKEKDGAVSPALCRTHIKILSLRHRKLNECRQEGFSLPADVFGCGDSCGQAKHS